MRRDLWISYALELQFLGFSCIIANAPAAGTILAHLGRFIL
jgi:hypothetical protein